MNMNVFVVMVVVSVCVYDCQVTVAVNLYPMFIYCTLLFLQECYLFICFSESIAKSSHCPMLFMCPSFCMQVRKGCYVCDCGGYPKGDIKITTKDLWY